MNPGDLFKNTYYIKRKLRTMDDCIDVYHVTYITQDGDKDAMLFLLDPALAGTKTGSVKFRSLYQTLRESGKIKKVLDYSMEGNDYYLIIPAAARQESRMTGSVEFSEADGIFTAGSSDTDSSLQVKKGAAKKAAPSKKNTPPKEHSLTRLLRIELYAIGAVVILCLIGAAGYYFTTHAPGLENQEQSKQNENQYTSMPDIVGLTINDAIDLLTENNLYYKITYEDSAVYIKDAVCRQSVEAGTKIERFSTVNLVVSNGIAEPVTEETSTADETETTTVQEGTSGNSSVNSGGYNPEHSTKEVTSGSCTVPDLTNVWESNAESVLSAAGLKLGTVYYEKHDGTERVRVYYKNVSAGDSVAAGTTVDIWVSGS